MKTAKITIPCYMNVGKKRPVNCLNLNWIINSQRFAYSNAKKQFDALIGDRVEKELPAFTGKVRVDSVYYLRSKRLSDIPNIDGGVMKFFLDTLQKRGIIVDDNWLYLVGGSYTFGGIDKDNPRCEVTITEIE